MAIHEKLKQARLDAGLSQKKLAEKLEVEQNFISRVESGKHDIKSGTIEKICKALGLDIKFIKKLKK